LSCRWCGTPPPFPSPPRYEVPAKITMCLSTPQPAISEAHLPNQSLSLPFFHLFLFGLRKWGLIVPYRKKMVLPRRLVSLPFLRPRFLLCHFTVKLRLFYSPMCSDALVRNSSNPDPFFFFPLRAPFFSPSLPPLNSFNRIFRDPRLPLFGLSCHISDLDSAIPVLPFFSHPTLPPPFPLVSLLSRGPPAHVCTPSGHKVNRRSNSFSPPLYAFSLGWHRTEKSSFLVQAGSAFNPPVDMASRTQMGFRRET